MKQSTKDRILSETPDEVKHRANLLVNKEKTVKESSEKSFKYVDYKNGFIAGVKWNQERSYTEQDMIDFAYNYTEERKNKGARALTPELLIKNYEKK